MPVGCAFLSYGAREVGVVRYLEAPVGKRFAKDVDVLDQLFRSIGTPSLVFVRCDS